jgi:LysM repeat protein
VRPGDTLLETSRVTGIPLQTIAQLNGINECAALYAGQVLKLPTSAQDVAPSASASLGISPPPCTRYVYRVQAGDTLPDIGERFGVPSQDIVAVNHLTNPGLLRLGQELVIPGR